MAKKLCIFTCCLLILGLVVSAQSHAGRIVLANDEWTLWNAGFSGLNDPGTFVVNVASWFTSSPQTIVNYSNALGSAAQSALTAAGYAQASLTPDNPAFWQAKALFLGGSYVDNALLTQYVQGGGNVYIAGGTGSGADWAWNGFLHAFGLDFAGYYNGVGGSIAISSGHPIFNGVDHLYQDNGQYISLFGSVPGAQILVGQNGQGLYAVYESAAVPLPPSMLLLAPGLVGLAGLRRRLQK